MSRSRSGRQAARIGRAFGGRRSWRAVRRTITVEQLTAYLKLAFADVPSPNSFIYSGSSLLSVLPR